MPKFAGSITVYPARALCLWYVGLIGLGSFLLTRPICGTSDVRPITWLEACFTATSASCVTGLTIRSTAHDFSIIGQITILLLIQLGGVGIMTVATFVSMYWSGRENLKQRAAMVETIGANPHDDLTSVIKRVVTVTFFFEGIGLAVLFVRFLFEMSPMDAAWHALFLSVSSFCNAGFALADDSLTYYRTDVVVNLTVISLIMIGGIGYPVLLDIRRNGDKPFKEGWQALTLHSKLMLIGTFSLVITGMLSILILEYNYLLADLSFSEKVLVSLFHSVSFRTAGFNTVDLSQMTNASLFITILFMCVGGGAGSTAGGFKVSTLMVLILHAWNRLAGRKQILAFRRSISPDTHDRAITTVMLFVVTGTIGLTLLLIVEGAKMPHTQAKWVFLDAMFEVFSALGTAGLSVSFTPLLNVPGAILIIMLMFIGRVGPVSMIVVLSRPTKPSRLTYPSDEVLIG